MESSSAPGANEDLVLVTDVTQRWVLKSIAMVVMFSDV